MRMNRPRLVTGGALVLLGVLFLLDAFDVVVAGEVIAGWWPLVVVAVGALRLTGRPPDVLGGGITVAIGLVLLAMTLDVIEVSVLALVWPLALIAVGLYLVLAHRRPARPDPDVDEVSAVVLFSGRELAPTSRAFTGGSLVAVFGGLDVDLRGCTLAEGARLDVTVALGGCDIKVPPGWQVRMTGPAILGGADNRAEGQVPGADAPTLDVRVLAILGGIEVNVAPLPVAPSA
jgi:hypothetical protein